MKLECPEGTESVAVGKHQYKADHDGMVEVPDEIAEHLLDSGFTRHFPSSSTPKLDKGPHKEPHHRR